MGLSIASGETVTIPSGERWLVGSTVENDGTLELAGTAMAGTAPAATGAIRVTGVASASPRHFATAAGAIRVSGQAIASPRRFAVAQGDIRVSGDATASPRRFAVANGDIRVTGTVAEPSLVRIIPRRSDFSVDTDREDSFSLDGQ